MRRRFSIFFIIMLAIFSSVVMLSCKPSDKGETGHPVKLSTPGALIVESGMLSWEAVPNADSYDVTVNGVTANTSFTVHTVYTFENKNATGIYEISVVAKPSATNKDNIASDAATLAYTVTPTSYSGLDIKSITKKVIEFFTVENGVNYCISFGALNAEPSVKTIQENTYDFSALAAGEYSLDLFVKGDGVYYLDSPKTKLEMVVSATDLKLRLARPSNFAVNLNVLTWDSNSLATSYKLEDVYGNITYSSLPTWNLEEKFLIHAIGAYTSSTLIAQSVTQMGIEYLEGKGTKDSPYLLKSSFDFRAVDYYERKYTDTDGKYSKRYYKLTADINFPPLISEQEIRNLHKIESFSGELDGDNHKITGIIVNNISGTYAPFEEVLSGAVIKNLVIDSASMTNYLPIDGDGEYKPLGAMLAGVAIHNYGTIENVTVNKPKLSAMSIVAGVACFNYGTIKGCNVNGGSLIVKFPPKGFKPKNEAAGVAVVNEGLIESCNVDETRIDGYRTVGGLVGINRENGRLIGSTTSAMMYTIREDSVLEEFGGLAGYNSGAIESCKNNSSITSNVGGGKS